MYQKSCLNQLIFYAQWLLLLRMNLYHLAVKPSLFWSLFFSFCSEYWTTTNFPQTVSFTAWEVSVFGVILVRIFPHSDWIRRDTEYECGKLRTRIAPNTDTFHTVLVIKIFINFLPIVYASGMASTSFSPLATLDAPRPLCTCGFEL